MMTYRQSLDYDKVSGTLPPASKNTKSRDKSHGHYRQPVGPYEIIGWRLSQETPISHQTNLLYNKNQLLISCDSMIATCIIIVIIFKCINVSGIRMEWREWMLAAVVLRCLPLEPVLPPQCNES